MLFQTFTFLLLFLPVTFVVYEMLMRHRSVAALWWLLLCSVVFYGWNEPQYVPLLLGSIGINYLLSRCMLRFPAQAKHILIVGVVLNLGSLVYFKYAGFLGETLHFSVPNIVLPLAISFFTFQQIEFLVQVSRGNLHGTSLLHYAAYISFFPQLIAGPIVQPQELLPQMEHREKREGIYERLSLGFTWFTLGLFKKVVFADTVAPYANQVFTLAESGAEVSLLLAWAGVAAFAFQIYFDFSAYSDMAIGIGRMFGFRLPQNFDAPYRSKSVTEFWRRWHITLSTFLREYLYFPLGGSRNGTIRTLRNLMITMLLSGLWHGAGWTFVLWGAAHGVTMCIERIWKRGFGWIGTFAFLLLTWVLFRAETLAGALHLFESMLSMRHAFPPPEAGNIPFWHAWWIEDGSFRSFAFGPWVLLAPIAAGIYIFAVPTVETIMEKYWRPNPFFALVSVALLYVSLYAMMRATPEPFIYFKF